MEKIIERLALELGIRKSQVKSAIELIDNGNTIPFIARYRKEVTGNLDDEILRNLNDRLIYLRNLEARKEEVIHLISELQKLTPELEETIKNANMLTEVEDLYRPYKQKKRTRAIIAKEKGLEELAKIILKQKETSSINEIASRFLNKEKEVLTVEDAINGACDIIAEDISDNAKYRKQIRKISYNTGKLVTTATKPDERTTYDMYYNFSENINKIPSHRLLAINRGEKEEALKVKFEVDEEKIISYLQKEIIKKESPFKEILELTINDAYKRLIKQSIEREIRADKFEEASEAAIKVFGVNIKNLILYFNKKLLLKP